MKTTFKKKNLKIFQTGNTLPVRRRWICLCKKKNSKKVTARQQGYRKVSKKATARQQGYRKVSKKATVRQQKGYRKAARLPQGSKKGYRKTAKRLPQKC